MRNRRPPRSGPDCAAHEPLPLPDTIRWRPTWRTLSVAASAGLALCACRAEVPATVDAASGTAALSDGRLRGAGAIPSPTRPDSADENSDEPIDWAGSFRHEVRYDPGRAAIVVEVELRSGFHAYTTGETIGRPLEVQFSDASAYVPDGPIAYPSGKVKDLPIGRSVTVEGRAEIVARVARRETADHHRAEGLLRYQVCTETACDRPRTASFDLAVGP